MKTLTKHSNPKHWCYVVHRVWFSGDSDSAVRVFIGSNAQLNAVRYANRKSKFYPAGGGHKVYRRR